MPELAGNFVEVESVTSAVAAATNIADVGLLSSVGEGMSLEVILPGKHFTARLAIKLRLLSHRQVLHSSPPHFVFT